MSLIKEPLEVDFVVDSRKLTQAEEKAISDFIKADKAKRSSKKRSSLSVQKAKRTAEKKD